MKGMGFSIVASLVLAASFCGHPLAYLAGTTATASTADYFSQDPPSWHHDCSNTTGWVVDPDPPPGFLWEVQSGISLLSDGDGLYTSSIPDDPSPSHGTEYFYELPFSLSLRDFLNVTIAFKHPGTTNRTGCVWAGLFDETKAPVFVLGVNDVLYSDLWWMEATAVDRLTSMYNYGSWTGTLSEWYDSSTGEIKGQLGDNVFTLWNGSLNPDVRLSYVGLVFSNTEDYAYESPTVLDIQFSPVPDTTPPTTDHPPDIAYVQGTTGHTVVWAPSDLNPSHYEILRNESQVKHGAWDGLSIDISVDGFAPAVYVFMLRVWDTAGNNCSDIVLVSVSRAWTWTDLLTDPAAYITIGSVIVIIWGTALIYRSRSRYHESGIR
ncbi:MAG: hypothetical protein C4K49_11955 [Candidatus Thorarchaeota archaeon]|nr:MAG: hypothetical protein C4K49_11955 [Candidatus Thorarchaeota archaeon]